MFLVLQRIASIQGPSRAKDQAAAECTTSQSRVGSWNSPGQLHVIVLGDALMPLDGTCLSSGHRRKEQVPPTPGFDETLILMRKAVSSATFPVRHRGCL